MHSKIINGSETTTTAPVTAPIDADADDYAVEKSVFKVSLYYLFAHFVALLIEAALRLNVGTI